ncbi:MAG: hypothetical protein PHH16_00970 [Candidatus Gracilibacteria bacterium]|nr:hypothetical protein [Candidatus Gracilibacteria bacterium]
MSKKIRSLFQRIYPGKMKPIPLQQEKEPEDPRVVAARTVCGKNRPKRIVHPQTNKDMDHAIGISNKYGTRSKSQYRNPEQ